MQKTVTVGVIAYNEQKYLPDLLSDLLGQSYPKHLIEVILVDGKSTDETKRIMKEFQECYLPDYRDIKIFDNIKRIQPAGWNMVIRNTSSNILIRIDAHARLPESFIARNIECINSGEYVCGGPRENIIDENTPWKKILLTAEQSMFGAGVASYRNEAKGRKYVKSVFHGAYRKEVIETVGMFNEDLIRTEDNEYHYRVREAGYKICYDPEIHSYYQTRSSLKGMIRQKYLNGLWIGKTLFVCPGCISLFHLVPFAFVLAIIISTSIGIAGIAWPALLLWTLYAATNIGMTVMSIISIKTGNAGLFCLPLIFLILHVSYGVGTLVGIIYRRL